jgi:type IV pilus assembly protein PilC
MKKFNYVAMDARGTESKGALEAADAAEALKRLKQTGFFPTKIVPALELAGHSGERRPTQAKPALLRREVPLDRLLPRRGERVKPRNLAVFTRQLGTLLKAGMPLVRGLRLLEEQRQSPAVQRVVRRLIDSIEGGSTFSEGLARSPKVFSPLYLSMARAGEASGALDLVLDRLASFQEKAEKIKGKVVAALFYPAAVLSVAAAIVGLMMVLVVPKFRAVFADLLNGQPLPVFTQIVFGVSQVVRDHFLLALAAGIALVIGFRMLVGTEVGRRVVDRFKLRIPLLGPVFLKAAISRFSRTLGTLAGSGVPILQALTIVKETAGNVIVGEAVAAVHRSVKEGETIAAPLRASGVFPALVVGMVEIGEQTGALPDMLMKIADGYDDEVDNAVSGMTSLLEPLLIVILGVVVGCIVIALFLPILQIYQDMPGGPSAE